MSIDQLDLILYDMYRILPDTEYNCLSQVEVEAIPYVEADNPAGGVTVTIAG